MKNDFSGSLALSNSQSLFLLRNSIAHLFFSFSFPSEPTMASATLLSRSALASVSSSSAAARRGGVAAAAPALPSRSVLGKSNASRKSLAVVSALATDNKTPAVVKVSSLSSSLFVRCAPYRVGGRRRDREGPAKCCELPKERRRKFSVSSVERHRRVSFLAHLDSFFLFPFPALSFFSFSSLSTQVANSIGLETKDGIFGFTPFAEVSMRNGEIPVFSRRFCSPVPSATSTSTADFLVSLSLLKKKQNPTKTSKQLWVGRLAMMGFLTSIVEEAATGGKGTLAQIGFETPSPALLTAFLLTFGGLTAASAVRTLADAASGKMSAADALRYGSFLGVKPEDVRAAEGAAQAMKRADDYSLPGRDVAAIEAARLQQSPADAVLGKEDAAAVAAAAADLRAASSDGSSPLVGDTVSGDAKAADAAAAALKSAAGETVSLSGRRDAVETFAGAGEANARYARRVELDNGRWAMVGFAVACAVEAYSGHGILGQLIDWFKFAGLLGEASGF